MALNVRIDKYGNICGYHGILWRHHEGRAHKLRCWLKELGVVGEHGGIAGTLTYTPDAEAEPEDAVDTQDDISHLMRMAEAWLEGHMAGMDGECLCCQPWKDAIAAARARHAKDRSELEELRKDRDQWKQMCRAANEGATLMLRDQNDMRDERDAAQAELASLREEREGERVVTVEIEPDPSGDSLMRRVVMHEPGRTDPWSFRLSEEGVRTLVGSNRAGYKYDLAIRRVEEKAEKERPWMFYEADGNARLICPRCSTESCSTDRCRNEDCGVAFGEPRDLPGNLT